MPKLSSSAKLRAGSRYSWEPCRIGTVGELYVALDLIERGFEPYMPVPGRNAKYDMIAYDPETELVYPVSVRTTTGKNGIASDRQITRDGGILAKVRYKLPHGVVRRLRDIPPPEPGSLLSRKDDKPTLPQPRISAAIEVMDFLRTVEPGTELSSQLLQSLFTEMSRASLYRGLRKARVEKLVRRGRQGDWIVLIPPLVVPAPKK